MESACGRRMRAGGALRCQVPGELEAGQPPATRMSAAREVASASVLAAVDIYAAMAEAAETVVHTGTAAASQLVSHKCVVLGAQLLLLLVIWDYSVLAPRVTTAAAWGAATSCLISQLACPHKSRFCHCTHLESCQTRGYESSMPVPGFLDVRWVGNVNRFIGRGPSSAAEDRGARPWGAAEMLAQTLYVPLSGVTNTEWLACRYGEDAGQAASNVAAMAKSATKVMRAKRTGMTSVATRIARHTAQGLARPPAAVASSAS